MKYTLACIFAIFLSVAADRLATAQRVGAPQTSKLVTRDGVELSIAYYPGRNARDPLFGKEIAPVVLLHDDKASQSMFSSLVARLQAQSTKAGQTDFAVVTVDLRGHGGSTRQSAPNGQARELDAAKLGRDDVLAMSALDMEAVRGFLVGRNDAGELNLNKLSLVGVGLGATVAANWAAQDWSAPALLVGKQGQDVKALVLISPRWKQRGIMLQQSLRLPALKRDVAWMLVYGDQNQDQVADARRLYRQLEKFHPEPASAQAQPRDLSMLALATALDGASLFSQFGQQLEESIVDFLTVHVAERELVWSQRRNVLQYSR